MAGYRDAITRINTLDKCLSNFGRKFYINNLVEECNQALSEKNPDTNGVKKRQVYKDLDFMREEYGAPIESYRDGQKTYLRYSDKTFSIRNTPITEEELNYLKSALEIIQRVQGAPQQEWLDTITAKIQAVKTKENNQIISLDENLDYSGTKWLTPLFNAILNKRCLEISYQPFGSETTTNIASPYHLKQYNKRWFLFCKYQQYKTITNLSLDRIIDIKEVDKPYLPVHINWAEYFDDIIGVTVPNNGQLETIHFLVTEKRARYIETKPIHGSQKKLKQQNYKGFVQFSIHVIPNFELKSLFLSFGEDLVVQSPQSLVIALQNSAKSMVENYKK